MPLATWLAGLDAAKDTLAALTQHIEAGRNLSKSQLTEAYDLLAFIPKQCTYLQTLLEQPEMNPEADWAEKYVLRCTRGGRFYFRTDAGVDTWTTSPEKAKRYTLAEAKEAKGMSKSHIIHENQMLLV